MPLVDLFRREPAVDGVSRLRAVLGLAAAPGDDEQDRAPADVLDAGRRTEALRDVADGARPTHVLVGPGPRGLRALVLLGALSLVLGGWFVWRARPTTTDVAAPTVVTTGGSAEPVGVVVVDVAGAVRRPGLVRLPTGSRVADAISAAGGLSPGATTVGLNLARKVADGEQVLVLPPGTSAAPAVQPGVGVAPVSGGKVDLNLATADQLDALPGVGPVLAERIVAWRTKNGRFASVDQLGEVSGIGEKKLESLRDLVTV